MAWVVYVGIVSMLYDIPVNMRVVKGAKRNANLKPISPDIVLAIGKIASHVRQIKGAPSIARTVVSAKN
jgi:hypothetical protein